MKGTLGLYALPLAGLLTCVGAVGACGEEAPIPSFPMTFTATSDPDVRLPGVLLSANGVPLGQTNEAGILQATLTGPLGSIAQIGVTCPPEHEAPASLPLITLRHVESLDPAAAALGLQVSVSCRPVTRHGVLIVRALGDRPQAGLPVLVDGRELARTDPGGVAHVPLDMPAGQSFQVLLATTDRPNLRPESPPRTFTFPDADEIFVFDQPFSIEEPPAPIKRRRPRPRPAQSTRPVEIRAIRR